MKNHKVWEMRSTRCEGVRMTDKQTDKQTNRQIDRARLTNLTGAEVLAKVTVERESRYNPDPKAALLLTNDTLHTPIERGVATSVTAPPAPEPGLAPSPCPCAVLWTRLPRNEMRVPAVRAKEFPVLANTAPPLVC